MDLDDEELRATRKLNGADKNNCLHCGKGTAGYCESCYQELIAENAKLQLKIEELEEYIDLLKTKK